MKHMKRAEARRNLDDRTGHLLLYARGAIASVINLNGFPASP
jgi:hypothetical protein